MYEIEADFSQLEDFDLGLEDLRPALKMFHAYMVGQIDEMFEKAGGGGSAVSGGTARGVYWQPYSQRYLGRKRPSGATATANSRLLQDTGRLRQLAATEVVQFQPYSVTFGTRLKYAAYQNRLRPFMFLTDDDADKAVDMVVKQMEDTLRRTDARNGVHHDHDHDGQDSGAV